MLRSVLPSKKSIKKARSRQTDLWYITRADARHLGENDTPSLGSVPASIRVNSLHTMYSKDAFKPPALPYCFGTHVKQEDTKLVQIQEVTGLLGGAITSILQVLASVRQRLQ